MVGRKWVLRFIIYLKKKRQNEKFNLDYLFDAQKLIMLIYSCFKQINKPWKSGRILLI